jgi:hypothetical protein
MRGASERRRTLPDAVALALLLVSLGHCRVGLAGPPTSASPPSARAGQGSLGVVVRRRSRPGARLLVRFALDPTARDQVRVGSTVWLRLPGRPDLRCVVARVARRPDPAALAVLVEARLPAGLAGVAAGTRGRALLAGGGGQ